MRAKDRTGPAGSLWDVPRLALDWDCGQSFIWAEIAAGRLKAVKMGRRTKVHHDEKLRYEAALPAVEIKQAA